MGSPKKVTVGYKYYFGIHMGLGMPLDELVAIRVGGKEAWRGSVTGNQSFAINQPNLFGGDKKEGGINGTIDVMMGDESQAASTRLVSMLGGLVPAFRGLATAFYDGQISSMTPYPKVWEFLRRGGERLFDGSPWYASKMHIWLAGGQVRAMNPAHILYLVFTSPRFRGISPSRMDDAAWRAAADKLHAEGLGLCLEWRRNDSYKNFVDTVLAHIGADVFDDRKTGLISIRLTRDDYNPEMLPLFDEDAGLLELNEDTRPSQESAPSELIVTYVDAIDGNQRQVRAVNAGVAARAGGRSAEKVDYPGAPTGDIAARLAQRDLRIKTSSLRRFKVVLDRRGRDIHPGQPFRIRSLRRGIDQIVVRAGRVDDQFLVDGKVVVTAIQDVFGLPQTSYVAVPPQGWPAPVREAVPAVNRRLVELTWRDVVSQLDPANVELLDGTEAVLGALAEPPSSMSFNFNIARRVGGSGAFAVGETGDWCPSAVIADAIPRGQSAVTVTLSSASRLELVAVGHAALLNNEILRVSAINTSTFTVTLQRGCIDTVPGIHATGSRIWFYDAGAGVDETVWTQGVGLQVKLLTNTSIEQLAVAAAPTDSITFNGRIGKPYPPARLRINNEIYPALVDTSNVSLSWAHRDRISQSDQVIDTTVGSIGPEPGTTYSARIIRQDNSAVLASLTGISGTAVTLLDVDYIGNVVAEVWSVRGGIESLQRHTHAFYLDASVYLVTEAGDNLMTEAGDYLITEEFN